MCLASSGPGCVSGLGLVHRNIHTEFISHLPHSWLISFLIEKSRWTTTPLNTLLITIPTPIAVSEPDVNQLIAYGHAHRTHKTCWLVSQGSSWHWLQAPEWQALGRQSQWRTWQKGGVGGRRTRHRKERNARTSAGATMKVVCHVTGGVLRWPF